MTLKIGELFAGYGGLGMGVQAAFGGDVVWYSDVCKFPKDGPVGHYEPHRGACRILAHRFPGVPNLGDVSAVDWSQVEPVDILTGGSPCQDLSAAGKRAGMTEGTRSNLWVAMREAIAQLRPSIVVWENVRGAYSAEADSALESDPGLLDRARRRDGEPVLRALGRVLGDLSDLGYDTSWHGLRAADIGAPHGRFRVFVVATNTQHSQLERVGELSGLRRGHDARVDVRMSGLREDNLTLGDECVEHLVGDSLAGGILSSVDLDQRAEILDGFGAQGDGHGSTLAPKIRADLAPVSKDFTLLPTPAVNDMGEGKTVERWDEWTADMQARHGNGNGHGKSLAIEAQRLLPTPRAGDGAKGGPNQAGSSGDLMLPSAVQPARWGQYSDAITRWEHDTGVMAPAPTMTSSKGNPQLAPAFVEWMMGLPAGWVTDVPGITRNEALKALGNGVVPQQAAAALRVMAAWEMAA